MGGDARQAIIDEDTKRKINATLPPQGIPAPKAVLHDVACM